MAFQVAGDRTLVYGKVVGLLERLHSRMRYRSPRSVLCNMDLGLDPTATVTPATAMCCGAGLAGFAGFAGFGFAPVSYCVRLFSRMIWTSRSAYFGSGRIAGCGNRTCESCCLGCWNALA